MKSSKMQQDAVNQHLTSCLLLTGNTRIDVINRIAWTVEEIAKLLKKICSIYSFVFTIIVNLRAAKSKQLEERPA